MGGGFRREKAFIYLWLIPVDVWQKSTQYCKVIILQLKKKRRNKFQKAHLLDFFIVYMLLYYSTIRTQMEFLPSNPDLPNLHISDLLRQVLKIIFDKNMCERAQWAFMRMCFTTFPFFLTLSAFKKLP